MTTDSDTSSWDENTDTDGRMLVNDPPSSMAKRLSSLSKTMASSLKILVHLSYLPLLAFFATRAVSPFAGTAVLYFHTLYTAGLCGYALAERRQRNGLEKSAAAAALVSEEEYDPVPAAVLLSALSIVYAVKVLWVSLSFSPGRDATVSAIYDDFSFMAIECLYFWTCFVCACLLKGALLTGQTLGMLGVSCFMSSFMLLFGVAILFGEAVAAVVPWIGAVYHKYKQLSAGSESSSCVTIHES